MGTLRGLIVAFTLSAACAGPAWATPEEIPTPQPVDAVDMDLVWIKRPDWMRVAMLMSEYRIAADGRATIECTLRNGRPKKCSVLEGTASNLNYGGFAKALAGEFKAAKLATDGRPTEGLRVRIPVALKAPVR